MATTFKTFSNNDIVSSRTLLHEAIPITGSIISGTYGRWPNEDNIKNYSHGMFQSVYDYPYLSSSANHLFDITCGYSSQSVLSSSTNSQNSKKINIYNQMAQILLGHSTSGTIKEFEIPGATGPDGSHNKMRECYFFNFSRLLTKDEIKKGSFNMSFLTGVAVTAPQTGGSKRNFTDSGAENNYFTNSPVGEYSILSASVDRSSGVDAGSYTVAASDSNINYKGVGLLFYQAGIAVLSSSLFWEYPDQRLHCHTDVTAATHNHWGGVVMSASYPHRSTYTFRDMFTGSVISGTADSLRNRIANVSFNNTTELNSTIYFCRANHNEFNYSSNPTYLTGSKIRVKNSSLDQPVSYITTIGMYSADNEMLAVAKLSEPIKKTPDNELTFRVRLDY